MYDSGLRHISEELNRLGMNDAQFLLLARQSPEEIEMELRDDYGEELSRVIIELIHEYKDSYRLSIEPQHAEEHLPHPCIDQQPRVQDLTCTSKLVKNLPDMLFDGGAFLGSLFFRHGVEKFMKKQLPGEENFGHFIGAIGVAAMAAMTLALRPERFNKALICEILFSPRTLIYIFLSISITNAAYQAESDKFLAVFGAVSRFCINLIMSKGMLNIADEFVNDLAQSQSLCNKKNIIHLFTSVFAISVMIGFIPGFLKTLAVCLPMNTATIFFGSCLSMLLSSGFGFYLSNQLANFIYNYFNIETFRRQTWKDILAHLASIAIALTIAIFYGELSSMAILSVNGPNILMQICNGTATTAVTLTLAPSIETNLLIPALLKIKAGLQRCIPCLR